MSEKSKLSGAEKGRENTGVLADYLANLKKEGRKIPTRNGIPNLSAIARACGFDRQVLYCNPGCKKMLEDAVAEVRRLPALLVRKAGTDAVSAMSYDDLRDERDRLRDKVNQLQGKIILIETERDDFRNRVRELEKKLAIEEYVTVNGRQVIP